MRFRVLMTLIVGMAFMLGQFGCSNTRDASTDTENLNTTGTVSVYVVNYPLQYFAQRIGGAHVEVHFLAPADEDPAYWMPEPETIVKVQQADLILLNGAGYEKWVDSASLPNSKVCDSSAAFAEDYITVDDAVTHSHGPEGKHAHGGTAFTTWLDPTLAVKQADAVRGALAELQPENAKVFQQNFDALQSDLDALDRAITGTVGDAADRPIVFSHPVYQYFARHYNLNAKSVHWEPNESPTDAMWDDLKTLLEEHPAKWMIWEGIPEEQTEKRLAQLGLRSVTWNPCGNVPSEGDYLSVQRKNLEDLAKVYAESP